MIQNLALTKHKLKLYLPYSLEPLHNVETETDYEFFIQDSINLPFILLERKRDEEDLDLFLLSPPKGEKEEEVIDYIISKIEKEKNKVTLFFLTENVTHIETKFLASHFSIQTSTPYHFFSLPFSPPLKEKERLTHPFVLTIPLIEEAELINERWMYRDTHSLELIKELISRQRFIGIRNVSQNNRLVSWTALHFCNAIGLLHTETDHRRQGLARVCVSELIERHKSSHVFFAYVRENNQGSVSLFTSLGFERGERLFHYMHINPASKERI